MHIYLDPIDCPGEVILVCSRRYHISLSIHEPDLCCSILRLHVFGLEISIHHNSPRIFPAIQMYINRMYDGDIPLHHLLAEISNVTGGDI